MSFPIQFRAALPGDGSRLWQLVQCTGGLELNSSYFYLAFAQFFGDTCLIAQQREELVGGVIAFRPPRKLDAIFVWQIGVMPQARRQGLGKRMLHELLLLPSCEEVRYVLATVAEDNEASRGMFQSFAKSVSAELQICDFFTSDLFPEPHEAEQLISIGPLSAKRQYIARSTP